MGESLKLQAATAAEAQRRDQAAARERAVVVNLATAAANAELQVGFSHSQGQSCGKHCWVLWETLIAAGPTGSLRRNCVARISKCLWWCIFPPTHDFGFNLVLLLRREEHKTEAQAARHRRENIADHKPPRMCSK